MRIAYLTNQYPKVSHTFIRREILALEALGCEVSRFSVRPTPDRLTDPADIAEQRRTQVLLDGGPKGIGLALSRMAVRRPQDFARASRLCASLVGVSERGALYNTAYLAEACLLVELCERAEIKHVHVHFGTNPATVAMLAAEMGGPGYSFTVHGPEEFDKPHAIHLRQKIERARFVVAISSFCRSQLYRWCAAEHWPKIHVVRCGVDADFLSVAPPPLPEDNQLVSVGRLCEQKGQLLLLDALSVLKKEGANFKLWLVGDGEMRELVDDQIAQSDLGDRVEVTGWANGEEVRSYLQRSRALVLPSFAEGLPMVLMESLALGRPVVSSYIAGIPELVRPGVNGWLVPAGSVDALVSALRELLNSPTSVLAELGKSGREDVIRAHLSTSNAQSLMTLFQATC